MRRYVSAAIFFNGKKNYDNGSRTSNWFKRLWLDSKRFTISEKWQWYRNFHYGSRFISINGEYNGVGLVKLRFHWWLKIRWYGAAQKSDDCGFSINFHDNNADHASSMLTHKNGYVHVRFSVPFGPKSESSMCCHGDGATFNHENYCAK
jgi:hypothetical protein